MASVRLDFVKPEIPDLEFLHIFEGTSSVGPFSPIEQVSAIGTYPNYISYYTTEVAADDDNWFTIEWEDTKGAKFGMSDPVKGNTRTVVGEIVGRVMLRDPNLNEQVVTQEALAAIELYFKTNPLAVDFSSVTFAQLSGLTLLTMARSYIFTSVTESTSDDYTAGLVSQKAGSSKSKIDLDGLIAWANKFLGMNYSVVMLMEEIEIAGGTAGEVTIDQSRLIVEFP